jgi:hypothetical protein
MKLGIGYPPIRLFLSPTTNNTDVAGMQTSEVFDLMLRHYISRYLKNINNFKFTLSI